MASITLRSPTEAVAALVQDSGKQQAFRLTKEDYDLLIDAPSSAPFQFANPQQLKSLEGLFAADITQHNERRSPTHDFLWFSCHSSDFTVLLRLGGRRKSGRRLRIDTLSVPAESVAILDHMNTKHTAPRYAAYVYKDWLHSTNENLFSHGRFMDKAGEVRGLAVRVDPGLQWPLGIPFDHFIQYPQSPYTEFEQYQHVDWVVTARSWLRVLNDRKRIDQLMTCRSHFLSKTTFIVNCDYSFWDTEEREEVRRGVTLLKRVDEWLRGVSFSRLHFSPDADTVTGLLTDTSIRCCFANFHTENGRWQTCHGEVIPLERLAAHQSLDHLDLVVASHCQSVNTITRSGPLKAACDLLLQAGVTRTGGSMHFEPAQDFLCQLLTLFSDTKALGPLLLEASIVAQADFDVFVDEVDEYLTSMGYPPIDRVVTVP